MNVAIINGVNLNMLAYRNRDIYTSLSYDDLLTYISKNNYNDYKLVFFQSNHEGEIVDYIHKCIISNYDAIIINPGAYAHYSYAIRDALEIFKGIKIEVHLSNVYERESFRKDLVISDVCDYLICNKKELGYVLALEMISEIRKEDGNNG